MKARYLAIFFLIVVSKVVGQIPSAAHQEMIVAHINTSFFLTGETLYFQIYCLDKKTELLSSLSRIAYAELVGSDSKPLARMKISLDDGVGSGDFFFHSNVPSGTYTLLVYTRWMRNFGNEDFFRLPLTVINPQLRPATDIQSPTRQQNAPNLSEQHSLTGISIQLNKHEFNSRELVELQLKGLDSIETVASVSVRVVEPELSPRDPWQNVSRQPKSIAQIRYIPDFRSELITGTIRQKDNNKPLAGSLITLSSPSKSYQFAVSTTDSHGRYYFNIRHTDATSLLLGIQGKAINEFIFDHEDGFITDHSRFAPAPLQLDTAFKSIIARRYLPMQVENAFYSAKRDSTRGATESSRFYSAAEKRYRLDDFTRFSTMDDVLREIIPEVVVRSREGSYSLVLVNSATGFRFDNQPLMLIDGIPVSDANILMKYDPSLIREIELVTQAYYYGGLQANGIISVQTYDGNAKDLAVDNFHRIDYIPSHPSKIYFSPTYNSDQPALKRIPDFRTQLYWAPQLRLTGGSEKTISFFTGDLPGKYVVEFAGINTRGEKIWWRREFDVRK